MYNVNAKDGSQKREWLIVNELGCLHAEFYGNPGASEHQTKQGGSQPAKRASES
jgi:hypothetical protein